MRLFHFCHYTKVFKLLGFLCQFLVMKRKKCLIRFFYKLNQKISKFQISLNLHPIFKNLNLGLEFYLKFKNLFFQPFGRKKKNKSFLIKGCKNESFLPKVGKINVWISNKILKPSIVLKMIHNELVGPPCNPLRKLP